MIYRGANQLLKIFTPFCIKIHSKLHEVVLQANVNAMKQQFANFAS